MSFLNKKLFRVLVFSALFLFLFTPIIEFASAACWSRTAWSCAHTGCSQNSCNWCSDYNPGHGAQCIYAMSCQWSCYRTQRNTACPGGYPQGYCSPEFGDFLGISGIGGLVAIIVSVGLSTFIFRKKNK